MLEALASDSLLSALAAVRANGGAPGLDGVTVDAFAEHSATELPRLQSELLTGAYRPQPVRALAIPKAAGGTRTLGIPAVRDRVVLEALHQLLAPLWEPTFSPFSFAYRPGRSAQDAVATAQRFLGEGRHWVVDLDIEKFFDHVDHLRLMLRLGQRMDDGALLDIIADLLRAGRRWPDGTLEPTREGIAQGSPLSPLLANIVLDELDQEFTRRGWPFVRYADDCLLLARTEAEGREILAHTETFLASRLHLRLNREKTRLVQPADTAFLGFTYRLSRYGGVDRAVTRAAFAAFRVKLDELARPRGGESLENLAGTVGGFVRGWSAYYGFAGDRAVRAARAHARARLRAAAWTLWHTPAERARQLAALGLPPTDAETTAYALHPPDEWGTLPALVQALPDAWFQPYGLGPRLPARQAKPAQPAELFAEVARLREENARLRAELAWVDKRAG